MSQIGSQSSVSVRHIISLLLPFKCLIQNTGTLAAYTIGALLFSSCSEKNFWICHICVAEAPACKGYNGSIWQDQIAMKNFALTKCHSGCSQMGLAPRSSSVLRSLRAESATTFPLAPLLRCFPFSLHLLLAHAEFEPSANQMPRVDWRTICLREKARCVCWKSILSQSPSLTHSAQSQLQSCSQLAATLDGFTQTAMSSLTLRMAFLWPTVSGIAGDLLLIGLCHDSLRTALICFDCCSWLW